MADIKITDLTALTSLANGDYFVVVDVSDTSMAASGTDKKITGANVASYLAVPSPAGSGSELQFRSNGTTFGAATGSSVTGGAIKVGDTLTIDASAVHSFSAFRLTSNGSSVDFAYNQSTDLFGITDAVANQWLTLTRSTGRLDFYGSVFALHGHNFYGNDGSNTGAGTWNLDGAVVTHVGSISINAGQFSVDSSGNVNANNVNVASYLIGSTPGVSGSFTTVDGKTVTVTGGLITSIV